MFVLVFGLGFFCLFFLFMCVVFCCGVLMGGLQVFCLFGGFFLLFVGLVCFKFEGLKRLSYYFLQSAKHKTRPTTEQYYIPIL